MRSPKSASTAEIGGQVFPVLIFSTSCYYVWCLHIMFAWWAWTKLVMFALELPEITCSYIFTLVKSSGCTVDVRVRECTSFLSFSCDPFIRWGPLHCCFEFWSNSNRPSINYAAFTVSPEIFCKQWPMVICLFFFQPITTYTFLRKSFITLPFKLKSKWTDR